MDDFPFRNNEQMQCRGILHIVEDGDTLYKIGKKYGVSVSKIMYANPYVNVYNLQTGDEICVPVMLPRMPLAETRMQSYRKETPAETYENHMGFATDANGQTGAMAEPEADGAYETQNGRYMGNFMETAKEEPATDRRETDDMNEEEEGEQTAEPDRWEEEQRAMR